MQPLDLVRIGLPRSRAVQCLVVTILYAALAWFALRAPISSNAPLVRVLGTVDQARESAVWFVQCLVWPLAGILLMNLVQDLADGLRRLRGDA